MELFMCKHCKPSENEAMEICKKIHRIAWLLCETWGPAPFVYRSIWGVVRMR